LSVNCHERQAFDGFAVLYQRAAGPPTRRLTHAAGQKLVPPARSFP
jgi:hypothetical protein